MTTDSTYHFDAPRGPPVLASVFSDSFHGCNKACIKAKFDIMCLLHQCHGRDYNGRYRILERLPRRRRKWDIDRDEETNEAWGIHAVFGVSFFRVMIYHLLIMTGPIIFWGLWIGKWPRDWQNASIPFFAVVALLSLFWLPLAHRDGEKRKNKIC